MKAFRTAIPFIIVGTLFLAACQKSIKTVEPSIPLSLTATTTPIQTPTLTPKVIPISLPVGVLTPAQRDRLSAVALKYIADTEPAAIVVSHSILPLPYEIHPASICGPLAIAILQDAGLLDPAVNRHDFWKLDPRPDVDLPLVEQTFSRERYNWYSFRTPINQFDFSAFPLYPGDFLYLYAGDLGSFEHMLVVSRVDTAGRVYTVTNLNTATGYLIQEKMLYDPSDPGVGLFADWTNESNWKIGLTGFGGFDLWRLKSTPPDTTSQQTLLAAQLQDIFTAAGGEWNMTFSEFSGPVYYERLPFELIHPASTIKVPLSMLYLKALEQSGVADLKTYLSSHALAKVALSELLSSMLVTSDEDATATLLQWTVSHINYQTQLSQWGIKQTWLIPRRSTAHEMEFLLQGLYSGSMSSPAARSIILDLLSTYSPNDQTRLGGELSRLMNGDGKIYNKRGTITAGLLDLGEVAIVEYHHHVYLVTLFAHPRLDGDTTYEQLDAAFPQVADALWQFMQNNP